MVRLIRRTSPEKKSKNSLHTKVKVNAFLIIRIWNFFPLQHLRSAVEIFSSSCSNEGMECLLDYANVVPNNLPLLNSLHPPLFFIFFRFLPMILPAGSEESINLNTLRTFRVLRPLKLVSGVPSESTTHDMHRALKIPKGRIRLFRPPTCCCCRNNVGIIRSQRFFFLSLPPLAEEHHQSSLGFAMPSFGKNSSY